MIEPSNPHSQPQPTLQESLAKKLQILQSQNNALRQQRQSFETNIHKYVKTISQLDDQIISLQKKNADIAQTNRQTSVRCRKLQLDLERANHQYGSLYNHLYIDRKTGSRNLIIKEMELSNQLNQIQHDGLSKIVLNLKETLNSKHQQIIALTSQTSKLKKDLLQSTYDFHSQITELKGEIARLNAEKIDFQIQRESEVLESTTEKLFSAKIEGLQRQLKLCQKEYDSISKELLQCKQQLNHYKTEADWLKISIQNNNMERESTVEFEEMRKTIIENITLKKRLGQEIQRFNVLVRNNPSILSQLQQMDLTSPLDELQNKYNDLEKQVALKTKEISTLNTALRQVQGQRNLKEQQLLKLKTKTVKAIDKLKKIINSYVPCINLYGYGEFGLLQQECKLIEQNSIGIEKEYDRISSELIQKSHQIKKSQTKIKDLQTKNQTKEEKINNFMKQNNDLKEQNQKLLATVEGLTERWNSMPQQQDNQLRYENQQLQMQSPNYDNFASNQNQNAQIKDLGRNYQNQSRVDALRELVLQLQKNRENMLQIIRSKDSLIAEANSQLKILRSQNKPKIYTFQAFPSPITTQISTITEQLQANRAQQLMQKQFEQYKKLYDKISSMGQLYQTQLTLLQQQHAKKQSDLSIKFAKILADNHQLQQRYNHLEKLYEESLEKRAQQKSKQCQTIHQQNFDAIQLEDHTRRDDKNIISETTIQIINDLLKKYQKQFNRFSSFYELQMVKAREIKLKNQSQLDHLGIEQELQQKIKRIEQLLAQNLQTIELLQNELKQKQIQFQIERQHYQHNEQISQQRLAQLQSRLNYVNSQLETFQKKNLDNFTTQEPNSKSLTFLITTISAKNQQITTLKQTLKDKEEQLKTLTESINNLQLKVQDQQSELERQQFKQFKQFIQNNDLPSILEKAYEILSAQPKKSIQE